MVSFKKKVVYEFNSKDDVINADLNTLIAAIGECEAVDTTVDNLGSLVVVCLEYITDAVDAEVQGVLDTLNGYVTSIVMNEI